jgi:thiol-disulfide isomerase/thioredoxin
MLIISGLNSYAKSPVSISGTILNFTGDKISLDISTDFISRPIVIECAVDERGKFHFEIDIDGAKPAIFRTGKNNIGILISEGDSIVCNFDYNNVIRTIEFHGNNANHYNYFVDYYREHNLPHAMFTKPDFSDVFELSPKEFKTYRKSKVNSDLKFLEEFISDNDVTAEFEQYCRIEINYSYYYALASYTSLRTYFKKIKDTLPDDFYSELTGELFNNDEFLISEKYCSAMAMYIDNIKSGTYVDAVSFYNKALNYLSKELNNKSLSYYQAKAISGLLISDAPNKFKDSTVNNFINKSKYPDYIPSITSLYSKSLVSRTEKLPMDVLNSEIMDTNGNYQTLGNVLKQFKNKVIYIDVWASFCGPCKIEMPYSEKIKQKLGNKDVAFLYFTIDKDVNKWKKAIDGFGITGLNYLIKDDLNSNIAKHFNIIGVPHYILIDKHGNVVFPSASRPSSVSLEHSLLALMDQ